MSTIIIITPPVKPQRTTEDAPETGEGYKLHVIQGEPTKKDLREILRGLLKDLRED